MKTKDIYYHYLFFLKHLQNRRSVFCSLNWKTLWVLIDLHDSEVYFQLSCNEAQPGHSMKCLYNDTLQKSPFQTFVAANLASFQTFVAANLASSHWLGSDPPLSLQSCCSYLFSTHQAWAPVEEEISDELFIHPWEGSQNSWIFWFDRIRYLFIRYYFFRFKSTHFKKFK